MPPNKRAIGEIATKVRSKNAGPFWVSIDVFCGEPEVYNALRGHLTTEFAAELFRRPAEEIKRFELDDLRVIKFSLPRPQTQGHRTDRDMHGAQLATLLAESAIPWA